MIIDLRSDTVTLPSEEMLKAMLNAKLGDDVFDEDPSVKQLEETTAGMFGKEAGLFCPSGTMTNQIAIKCHTQPGDEVICDKTAHIYNYEGGGIAFHSGASVRLINGDRGIFTPEDVINNIHPENIHYPSTSLVSIENTCNRGGGRCWELEEMKAIRKVCKENKLKLHLDGARIFNAIIAKGYSSQEVGDIFDTISVCLSKGLGAPAGSVLIGDRETIKKAKRFRKLFGGGMRQTGILAAAGTFALENNIDRLKEDHIRAKKIEDCLFNSSYMESMFPVETNILVFKVKQAPDVFLSQLAEKGIKAVPFGEGMVRMVTHLNINDEMTESVCNLLKELS
jgi:threonine aldolase